MGYVEVILMLENLGFKATIVEAKDANFVYYCKGGVAVLVGTEEEILFGATKICEEESLK